MFQKVQGVIAVSYTHLDVYKRQVYILTISQVQILLKLYYARNKLLHYILIYVIALL